MNIINVQAFIAVLKLGLEKANNDKPHINEKIVPSPVCPKSSISRIPLNTTMIGKINSIFPKFILGNPILLYSFFSRNTLETDIRVVAIVNITNSL